MKTKSVLLTVCLFLFALLSPLSAIDIKGDYQVATADRGIWYRWSELPGDIRELFQNTNGNYAKEAELWYHLGTLTATYTYHPDDSLKFSKFSLYSPYSGSMEISYTDSKGISETMPLALAAGTRIKQNGTTIRTQSQQLAPNYASSEWGACLYDNYSPFTQDTTLVTEFYLYTLSENTPDVSKTNSTIKFQNVSLNGANLIIYYQWNSEGRTSDTVQTNGSSSFNYWGGSIPDETHPKDAEDAQPQSFILEVTDNSEDHQVLKSSPQHVASLDAVTTDNQKARKHYILHVAMYDAHADGTENYYLYRRDDASNDTDNAFKVQLEVNGTFVENTKNPSQPITIDVAQGEAESGSYGVEAVFPAQDGLPAGTYTDTVYVDFVTGDSQ